MLPISTIDICTFKENILLLTKENKVHIFDEEDKEVGTWNVPSETILILSSGEKQIVLLTKNGKVESRSTLSMSKTKTMSRSM